MRTRSVGRPGLMARRALAIVLGVACVLSTLVVTTAAPVAADPGHPGEPAPPVELFHEDFQAPAAELPMLLSDFERADGGGYTAHPAWISAASCNGILTAPGAPDMAGCVGNNSQIRNLAGALGTHNGLGTDNVAVSAYTAGDPGANLVQLATVEPLEITVENRFLAFSVNAVATNCGVSAPLLQFFLDDGEDLLPATATAINPCAVPGGVGTFTSDQGILFTGTSLGVVMTNANGSGNGNDGAFDDIRILDVTPQLDKAFEPAAVRPGGTTTITFTVTNTDELGAKAGWSFTEQLPSGLTIAGAPAFTSSCATVTAGGTPGSGSVSVTGSLPAGAESCTISIDVVVNPTATPGTVITNVGAGNDANVVDLVGLDAPGDALLAIPNTIDPQPCVEDGIEYALVTFNPPVAGEVVASGGPGTWARYGDIAVVDGTSVDMVATVLSGSVTAQGFRSVNEEARWNLATGATTEVSFAFYEAGTDTPFPMSAAFVTSDLDSGEQVTFDAADLAGYTLPVSSWVTVTETEGAVTFNGGGSANFDPRASFQTLLQGITEYRSTWSGFSNSGFQLNGNGTQVFPPQCWNAEKTVVSEGAAAPGATVAYEVTLTNTGEVDLTDLTVVDDLSGVLSSASWVGNHAASAGTLTPDLSGETLTWTGDLPLGAPVTISYSVVIHDDAVPGDDVLVNTLTGPTNCPGASCTTSTPIVDPVPLFFDCSALTTFDDGNAGWRVVTVEDGAGPPVIGPQPVEWTATEGNPGGAAVSDDLDSNWTEIWTPELRSNGFATDYSDAIGDALRFDFRNDTGIGYDLYVAVEGASGDRAYFVFRPQVVDSTGWNTILVPLDPTQWVTGFDGTSGPVGPAPSVEDFTAILADVDHFAFSVEGQFGSDRTWFDNFGQACPDPDMTVEKGYEHDDADEDGELSVGEEITYSFTVTNTGDTQLTDIVVTDELPGLGPIVCPTDRLFPGDDPMVCTATYVVDQDDIDAGGITNVASASGTPPVGPRVDVPSNEVVIEGPDPDPGLSVTKGYEHDDADEDGELSVGEEVTFLFTVANTGNVTISDIAVVDPLPGLGPVACPATELTPATDPMVCSAVYVVAQADIDAGGITNQAVATGTSPGGDLVEVPSNEVTIDGPDPRPEIDLVKTAGHHDGDRDGRVAAGEQITYSFLVTNTGNVTLTDVTIEDPMPGLSAPTCPEVALAPGESLTCTAGYVVTSADEQAGVIVNTATASADGPSEVLARATSAPSTATTQVEGPAPAQSGVLPRTGSSLADLALVAIGLLLAGRTLTRRRPLGHLTG